MRSGVPEGGPGDTRLLHAAASFLALVATTAALTGCGAAATAPDEGTSTHSRTPGRVRRSCCQMSGS